MSGQVVLSPGALASVHRAANVNPLRELLRGTRTSAPKPHEDVISIVWWLFAAVAVAAAGIAFFYVQNETPKFSDVTSTSVRILKRDHRSSVALAANGADYHYVAMVPKQTALLAAGAPDATNPHFYVSLPPLAAMRTGRFVSIAVPMPPGEFDGRVYVQCASEDASACGLLGMDPVPAKSGAMFMVVRELGALRWKRVRTWWM